MFDCGRRVSSSLQAVGYVGDELFDLLGGDMRLEVVLMLLDDLGDDLGDLEIL